MDPYTLLCETCGYNLEAASGMLCPECGRPVAQSAPAHRTGIRWQRRGGLSGWAKTFMQVLFHPGREFDRMSLAGQGAEPGLGGGNGFLAVNLLLGGAIIAAPWTGTLIGDWSRGSHGSDLRQTVLTATAFAAQTAGIACLLLALTGMEAAGMLIVGRTRQWRLTRRGSWLVCCYASVGWVLAGVFPMILMALWYILGTRIKLSLGRGMVPNRPVGSQLSWHTVLAYGLPLLGYFAGLMVFESLVYVGSRRCKFAAIPREAQSGSIKPGAG